jgi:hypothetical protein
MRIHRRLLEADQVTRFGNNLTRNIIRGCPALDHRLPSPIEIKGCFNAPELFCRK